ncbi:galactosamine-6-phosphate isomerase [Haliscomenobacter hydrossis]|uniref:Glucosamine-6-phosphate deaminase n=1 Tax=Haliscomenobacter hydrossis (strain ATCC 27775 / DSM 1100 / LMG 10767 / O) TaxID=760192 RepID=F4KSX7_HALH1|nr:galactosamine-6-phosphate isomerase [Haliscomenobacter hydrossis]AEE49084.1 Glucosamine-6-phosphate deaminase [Haliscomenobacter hydrossis DSM 1100]
MDVTRFDNEISLAEAASDHILQAIQQKPDLLLCAATGNTPTLSYQKLVEKASVFPLDQLRLFKLDEWGGVPMEHSGTCETYLQQYLISPLRISTDRYFSFQSNPADPEQECVKVQKMLEQQGPIDLCILGLGLNGHLAFNEPGEYLQPHCHVAQLTEASLGHSMAQDMEGVKLYGLTLGMSDILAAKEIMLLISGASKVEITKRLLEGKISTQLPASFLWLHPKVKVYVVTNFSNDE